MKKEQAATIKLTHYTHGLGCACKIEPAKLEEILRSLPLPSDKNILVGTETSDDAAVYKISDELALVVTLDFFTPIVDDPYSFGAIAAANALSDIYAMGAKPLLAMNIVGFPEKTLPLNILQAILKGAQDKAGEAGISIIGGHTIEDPEPKYGMVVCGTVHPGKIIRNTGAQPGDFLVLTKALGTGILSTALKRGMLDDPAQQELIMHMATLNRDSAMAMEGRDVHACTDVTGFGLLGHLREMTKASKCDAEIIFSQVPLLNNVDSLATAGVIPGGSYNNLEYVSPAVRFGSHSRTRQLILCDAQTSGGLLLSLPEADAKEYVNTINDSAGGKGFIIGRITGPGSGEIHIKD
ncbi:selenide, water dikinase SelD [Bacteroidota bacterium]